MMRVEEGLAAFLAGKRISPVAEQLARTCIEEIQRLIEKIGSHWRVRAFGSFANGLWMEESDLDATCYSTDPDVQVNGRTNMDFLLQLQALCAEHKSISNVEFVASARVPILKLRFRQSLDVDVSCNNVDPFRNTQLLRAYTDLNPLVRDLALLVKLWAKGVGIVGAKDGHLSSYSFTLMAIYFMQVDHRICLPCLPTSDFDGSELIPTSARLPWSIDMPRAAILYMFFNFYAYDFQWNDEVVGVHVGSRQYKTDPAYMQLKDIWESRLHIADPFLMYRNLNCVLKPANETLLYNHIQAAAQTMYAGRAPQALSIPTYMTPNMLGGGAEPPHKFMPQFQGPHNYPGPLARGYPTAPPQAAPHQLALMSNSHSMEPALSNSRPPNSHQMNAHSQQGNGHHMSSQQANSHQFGPGQPDYLNRAPMPTAMQSPPSQPPQLQPAMVRPQKVTPAQKKVANGRGTAANNVGGASKGAGRGRGDTGPVVMDSIPMAPRGEDVPATRLSVMKF